MKSEIQKKMVASWATFFCWHESALAQNHSIDHAGISVRLVNEVLGAIEQATCFQPLKPEPKQLELGNTVPDWNALFPNWHCVNRLNNAPEAPFLIEPQSHPSAMDCHLALQ